MTYSNNVIKQIESEYGDLHDALIVGFNYVYNWDTYTSNICIRLSAHNLDGVHRDIIELEFINVKNHRFNGPSGMVYTSKADTTSDAMVLIDFDPIIESSDGNGNLKLEFNQESACKVESSEIKFTRLERKK